MRFRPCLRSGYCCQTATCVIGLQHGAEQSGCKFLKGEAPGDFSCQLAEKFPEGLAIGAGCCSPLNSTRQKLFDQEPEE